MNNNPPHGATPGGQQAHPPQARQIFFRPEQMRNLPEGFTAEEKKKWENGLIMLYKQMETHPQDSQLHMDARKKVQEFSISLQKKIQANRQQQSQAAGQGQSRPVTQGGGQAQVGGDAAASNPNPSQQNRTIQGLVKPSEQMIHHINTFPYVLPPQLTAGTPEAVKWLSEIKNKYGKALLQMESSGNQLKFLDSQTKERNEKGMPLNEQELKDNQMKKEHHQKLFSEARSFTERFRKQQEQQNAALGVSVQHNSAVQPTVSTGAASQRPAMTTNQQSQAAALPDSVQAAMQAARNSSINTGRPSTASQSNEQASSVQNIGGVSQPNGHPTVVKTEGPGIKVEGGISQPQINTTIATASHMQASISRAQNSPHSAAPQSATSTGAPRPLTHQAALSQAARTYSSGQTSATPNVIGSHSHPSIPRDGQGPTINKMPIPKQLPSAALGPPQPVSMAPSRPTMSGGPNNAGSGVMGQPALTKPPGFTFGNETERVMNKKKLDELVRQVTGGGEGLDSGEGLTPEVEDSVLSVADEFVDQVITAACKCAKARGSKTLEIRDIQLILERNYNIRIPGYASDEIRTVRKFQPAQGWIAKMSAIQAAKVTGGKGDS